MLGLETVPAMMFFITCLIIPESPRWLILKGRTSAAAAVLGRIYRDTGAAESEKRAISESLRSENKSEWRELLRPGIRKAVVIGVFIAILGQFMGVNAVLYYGPTIFEDSGLSSGDSLFYQVLVGSVNMLTCSCSSSSTSSPAQYPYAPSSGCCSPKCTPPKCAALPCR